MFLFELLRAAPSQNNQTGKVELVAKGISVLFPSCHIQKGARSCHKICFCYQKCRFPASLSSFLHLRGGGSCPQGRVCEAAHAAWISVRGSRGWSFPLSEQRGGSAVLFHAGLSLPSAYPKPAGTWVRCGARGSLLRSSWFPPA